MVTDFINNTEYKIRVEKLLAKMTNTEWDEIWRDLQNLNTSSNGLQSIRKRETLRLLYPKA